MADWLILRKDPTQQGAKAWQVVALATNKTADAAGATQALTESYEGPGKYGVIRADNARTVSVDAAPSLNDDSSPQW